LPTELETSLPSAPPAAAAELPPCYAKDCAAAACYRAVLHVAQEGKTRLSPVALPVHLCAEHRDAFREIVLGAYQRRKMEESLESRGKAAPDWSRSFVEFVGPD
jgi:hypothetical protein